jgi:Fusaric acid resistance protein-like
VDAVRHEHAITWDWADAGRGGLCALPGAVIVLAVDVGLGVIFALGTVVVAMLGVPPGRSQRARLGLVGLGFAVAYGLGSTVALWEVAAVVALTLLAYAAVLLSERKPAAKLLPAMLVPAFALGMNHPAPDGFVFAGVLLAGGAWATLVTYLWPQTRPPGIASRESQPEPAPASARRAGGVYAVLFAAAAGIGLALGFLLDLTHVAWAAAAALFIMRPDPGLLASRAVGRTVATLAGVVAARLIYRRGPSEIAIAVVTIAAVSAMVATRTSRWYVSAAGSGLIVLLVSGVGSKKEFDVSFVERLGETAIGAGLALTFGVAVPFALRRLAPSRAAATH